MSRIPARGAVAATGTASAVLALCLLGGLVTQEPGGPDATADMAATSAHSATADDTVSVWGAEMGSPGFSYDPGANFAQVLDSAMHLGIASNALVDTTFVAQAALHSAVTASSSPAPAPVPAAPAPPVVRPRPATPREIARSLAAARGWAGPQWSCLDQLWQHESRFQPTARNYLSGAYGVPQALPASKMASAGSDWRVNPVTQIRWGLGYIRNRYGSPCNAWSYWLNHGSY